VFIVISTLVLPYLSPEHALRRRRLPVGGALAEIGRRPVATKQVSPTN
jgi:hypothetical protein